MNSQEELIKQVRLGGSFRTEFLVKILRILANLVSLKHDYFNKPIGDYCYLTICGKDSFFMLRNSIYSFLKNSDTLPNKVVIISDGTWDLKSGEKYFKDFKVSFVFENWEQSAKYHTELKRANLYTWACKQIWGKKMAAILKYSEFSLVLFADSDVLWYSNIISQQDFKKENILKISKDNSYNYDHELIGQMNAFYLYDLPPVNCGVILIKGNMFDLSKTISEAVDIQSKKSGNFSEQTVFAIMLNEFGELWSDAEIMVSLDDILSPILKVSNYTSDLKARHYVWKLKWLYWRDVLTKKFIRH